MKKIYLSLVAAAGIFTCATAQQLSLPDQKMEMTVKKGVMVSEEMHSAKTNSLAMTDTLWYSYNKHFYENTPAVANQYWVYPSPYPSPTISLTHFGLYYQNTGTVVISGLEAMLSRKATSTSPSVTARVLLYNCDAFGNVTPPAIDSITGVLTGTSNAFIGGNFTIPKVVTGNYAVMYRCASPVAQDTIFAWATDAKTNTYGEGFGRLRLAGTYSTTTGILGGATGDREFVVAPRVSWALTADHSNTVTAACNNTMLIHINTSSWHASHRQYNLNQFYRHWRPFSNTVTITPDSVFTWAWGDSSPLEFATSPNHQYISVASNQVISNNFLVKVQKMSDYSSPNVNVDTKTWSISISVCNVGLTENSLTTQVGLYPNPADNKVTVFVNNATPDSQITVLNALGQVVLTRSNLTDKNELNTESLTKGVYFVRVGNGKNTTTTKLIISK